MNEALWYDVRTGCVAYLMWQVCPTRNATIRFRDSPVALGTLKCVLHISWPIYASVNKSYQHVDDGYRAFFSYCLSTSSLSLPMSPSKNKVWRKQNHTSLQEAVINYSFLYRRKRQIRSNGKKLLFYYAFIVVINS